MHTWPAEESFRGLVLRHRGRTGLTQRELAARVGVNRRTLQGWEVGVTYPSTERLQALIRVLLEAGGLSVGHEREEAQALWASVMRDAPRMHPPFDEAWFAGLRAAVARTDDVVKIVPTVEPHSERGRDWGEAPDVLGFVGRADEQATLHDWMLQEGCRLVAVLG